MHTKTLSITIQLQYLWHCSRFRYVYWCEIAKTIQALCMYQCYSMIQQLFRWKCNTSAANKIFAALARYISVSRALMQTKIFFLHMYSVCYAHINVYIYVKCNHVYVDGWSTTYNRSCLIIGSILYTHIERNQSHWMFHGIVT